MARKAIKHRKTIHMTRGTALMLKQVATEERRAQGDVIQRALSLYLDLKDNKKSDRSGPHVTGL